MAMTRQSSRRSPSFAGLKPASRNATAAAIGASGKTHSRCELALRRELWHRGFRYRLHVAGLPGRPDIVFTKQRLAVFCDGDFWHGRNLDERLGRLAGGHNAVYWVGKIRGNAKRDRRNTTDLVTAGWNVLRFWESDLLRDSSKAADHIEQALAARQKLR